MALFNWLCRNWPLAWKSSVLECDRQLNIASSLLADARKECDIERAAKKRAIQDKINACQQMSSMQIRFTDMMDKQTQGRFSLIAEEIMVRLSNYRPEYIFPIIEPLISVSLEPIRMSRIPIVKVAFEMGLSERAPPELVAKDVSQHIQRQVEMCILDYWRKQSILLDPRF